MTTATATEGLTAYAFYLEPELELDEEIPIYFMESEDSSKSVSITELDEEVIAFLSQPGQRYKVTITRAEEEAGDGR